ncbi:MAG: prepilin-type N-terminal cleavage/methylation domain-containing protein [Betaproteobacteria bacterium]|nr:prepilin-type N-terminal cleavage/methylation domain-containing protein [Betaproteobacteria bacterium]
MKKHAGFSLLEAIVSLVLVATAGMALFSWINVSFISLSGVQAANARAAAETNALHYLRTINPMARPSGSVRLGALSLEWQAKPLTAPQSNVGGGEGPGPFRVALYQTEVTLEEQPLVPRYRFTLYQMGYERDPFIADPFGEVPINKPKTPPKATSGK